MCVALIIEYTYYILNASRYYMILKLSFVSDVIAAVAEVPLV